MHDHRISIIIAALAVLVLGALNPVILQSKQNSRPSGHPSYLLLSLAALVAGLLSCYLLDGSKKGGKGGNGLQRLMSGEYL